MRRRQPTDARPRRPRSDAPTGSSDAARRLFAMSQPIEVHARGSVSAPTRHYGFARNRQSTLPPALLLPARRAQPDRDMASHDRRRHRSLRIRHRRASHLARSGRLQRGDARQGADRHAETGNGRPARSRRALRRCAARSWRRAKASRRCSRFAAFCPPCRWPRRSRRRISPPSCFRTTLRRLYIARDNDPAGDGAMMTLIDRAQSAGIEALVLSPALSDFNEDLRLLGIDALRAALRVQIAAEDVARFMDLAAIAGTGKTWRGRHRHEEVGGHASPRRRRGPRPRPSLEGDRAASGADRQWLRPTIFRRGPEGRFPSRSKIAGLRHPPPRLRPFASAAGAGPRRPPPSSP